MKKAWFIRSIFQNFRQLNLLNRNYSSQETAFAIKSQRYRNSFQKFNQNKKFDGLSELAKVDRNEVKSVSDHTIKKNNYTEHSTTAARSEDEIKNYRACHGIHVRGVDIPKPILSFDELCLPEKCIHILQQENYSEPTPIQSYGFPIALCGRDLIGVSQTGSGKTLAYMLPAIVHASNQLYFGNYQPQVLVLGPTRELIQQIYEVSKNYIRACGLFGACAFGGSSKLVQLDRLKDANIVIGTPGRLLDFLSTNAISMRNCSCLVLDEADRMLDMGFEPQIRGIVQRTMENRQTMMWSATWPSEIRSLAEEFLTDYIHITVGSGELRANPNIQQNIHIAKEHEKDKMLISMLDEILEEHSKVLIFAQTKQKVDYLSNLLKEYNSLRIHGDVSQYNRNRIIKTFRTQQSCVLVATDIAARGLDITDIDVVVNYDFPLNIEDYIHRIGRTARGSSSGVAHSFFTPENFGLVKDLVTLLKSSNQYIDPQLLTLRQADRKSYRYPAKFHHRRNLYRDY